VRQGKVPKIRLSKTCLVFNKQAREVVDGDTVELAFDPETGMVRVTSGGKVHVRKTKIFAKGFYRRFGITVTGKFDAEVVDGALIAKIS
jgi:hypothetical protein